MKFYYKLPNSDKEIVLEISDSNKKYFTLIYGPNGIGKSSFVNSVYKN